ncbi:MAG: ABC transporter ATP-binding protein [Fibrobacterales bacterium]
MAHRDPILEVKNLTIDVPAPEELRGQLESDRLSIVKEVSFEVQPGEIYSLVGESGSGKTVSSLAVLGFLPQPGGRIVSGDILFNGKSIPQMSKESLRSIRGRDISMIFQEPGAALNPIVKVSHQLLEVFSYHPYSGNATDRIRAILQRVGFPEPDRVLNSYPHELSGGMQQRVMIAMALLLKPSLIIADEPTTALDVTVQKQVMDLIVELQEEEGCAVLFITHNLALVSQYADRLSVMKDGRIVEANTIDHFFDGPTQEYSRQLLAAVPRL